MSTMILGAIATLILLGIATTIAEVPDAFLVHMLTKANTSVPQCDNFYRHVCPLEMTDPLIWLFSKFSSNPEPEEQPKDISGAASALVRLWQAKEGLRQIHSDLITNTILSLSPNQGAGQVFLPEYEDEYSFAFELIKTIVELRQEVSNDMDALNEYMDIIKNSSAEKISGYFEEATRLNRDTMGELIRRTQEANWTQEKHGDTTIKKLLTDLLESTHMSSGLEPNSAAFNYSALKEIYDDLHHRMNFSVLDKDLSFGNIALDKRVAECKIFSEYMAEKLKTDPGFFHFVFGSYWNAHNAGTVGNTLIRSVFFSIKLVMDTFTSGLQSQMRNAQYRFVMGHELMHSFIEHWDKELAYKHRESYRRCLIGSTSKTCNDFREETCASGNFTYSEDGPDVEGARMAYKLFLEEYNQNPPAELSKQIRQMFFYSLAMQWCYPYDSAQHHMNKDGKPNVHSAPYARINNVMRQMPEFAEAFDCADDDAMVLPKEDICVYFPPADTST